MKDTVIRVLLVSHVLLCFPLINRKDTVFSLSNYVKIYFNRRIIFSPAQRKPSPENPGEQVQ